VYLLVNLFSILLNTRIFAMQTGQRVYTLLLETDFSQCSKGDIVVSPANTAVYRAQKLTCGFSQFSRLFSLSTLLENTAASLSNSDATAGHLPLLEFQRSVPALNCLREPVCFTTFQPAISTWNNTDGAVYSETLLTGRSPILVDYEFQWLHDTAPTVFEKLHDIGSYNTTLRKTLDVDLLFQLHDVSQRQGKKHSTD
jgi:hypothetical protein